MIDMQNVKFASMLAPISINATAATTLEVDTKGWAYATVVFYAGSIGANMDEVTLQESDTTGSNFTNITGATLTDPVATTDNGKIWVIHRKLGGTSKRFLKPVIDPGAAATVVACLCILSRGEAAPSSATEAGLAQMLIT